MGTVTYFQLHDRVISVKYIFFNSSQKKLHHLLSIATQPEGKYALHIACETNQVDVVGCLFFPKLESRRVVLLLNHNCLAQVKYLLMMGARPEQTDINGNNALHYAALASVQMLETILAQSEWQVCRLSKCSFRSHTITGHVRVGTEEAHQLNKQRRHHTVVRDNQERQRPLYGDVDA
jgi:hypothetical protein